MRFNLGFKGLNPRMAIDLPNITIHTELSTTCSQNTAKTTITNSSNYNPKNKREQGHENVDKAVS